MAQSKTVSLYQQADQAGLSLDSNFTFSCHEDLGCFNRCCRTPTILLSPYDLMQLQGGLGVSAAEFLRRYAREEIEEQSRLPLVFIDTRKTSAGCPFVGVNGCTVYRHRPAACRLFPITMGSRLIADRVVDYYFCRRLDYCRGFEAGVQWTVESWRANQGFDDYDQGRRDWLKILLRRGQEGHGADALMRRLFAVASYDLAEFRRLISESPLLAVCGFPEDAAGLSRSRDPELLAFACRFLERIFFPELSSAKKKALRAFIRPARPGCMVQEPGGPPQQT